MSFQAYLNRANRQAEDLLDIIPEDLCTPVEPIEYKALRLEKAAQVVQSEVDRGLGLSPVARSCLNKIAEEITQVTLRSSLEPIKDRHYKYLMKQAGVTVPEGRNDYLNNLLDPCVSLTHRLEGV